MSGEKYADIISLLIIPLWILASCTSAVNFTEEWKHILKEYAYVCGNESICDKNLLYDTTPVEYSNSKTNLSMTCLKCSCDDSCSKTGNCCLDIAFSSCVQTSHGSEWPDEMYHMKNYCPPGADKELISKCQITNTYENMLKRNPVTSKSTKITYSNIYCARCNNDFDVLPWIGDTKCIVKLKDFTSKDELWKFILDEHLSFHYIPSIEIMAELGEPKRCDASLIKRCNATGVTRNYTSMFHYNVEKACAILYQPTGVFQNPFCLLCNIRDETITPPISMCNATGRMGNSDDDLRKTCLNESLDLLRYPYKNKHCEECNLVKTKLGDIQMSDAEISVNIYNKPVQKSSKSLYQFYLSEITITAINYSKNPTISQFLPKINFGLMETITIPDKKEFGWIKQKKWCRIAKKYFFPDNRTLSQIMHEPPCSCITNCSKENSCCKARGSILKQIRKWGCEPTSFPRSYDIHPTSFFMIRKCPNKYKNAVIRNLCESDKYIDMLSFVPVTEIQTLKTYKNYFCFFCFNSNTRDTEQIQTIPWKINLECPNIYNFKHEVKFGSMMQKSMSRNCSITVHPYLTFLPPKCEFPGIENLYCSLCERSSKAGESCPDGSGRDPDLRSIFSILENDDKSDDNNHRSQCSSNEIFDNYKGSCRRLLCSSGKLLVNGECIYFFSTFSSTTYNVAFTASYSSKVGPKKMDIDLLIKSITTSFTDQMFKDTNLFLTVIEYHFRFNKECQKIVTFSGSEPLILTVFMKIYIQVKFINQQEIVDLILIEYRLYEATLKTGSFGNVSFEYFDDAKGWFLQHLERVSPLHSFCNKRFQLKIINVDEASRDITKLLLCPQISLSRMEFTFSNDGLQIFVPVLSRTFYYNQFSIAEDNTVRICASDYMSSNSPPFSRQASLNLLQILTIISTSISLVSLVITFTLYGILKSLRTIPGQTLMCFVFSLFFAQLFSLIKGLFIYDDVACATVGIVTYYFWLSTFTCATSCCIHMFRVFASDAQFNNKKPCNRTLLTYIFFTYLTPLVFIFVTIGYHASFSSSFLTGFGGIACFINGGRYKLFIFIIPISVFCFVNFLLFSVTFFKIHRTPEIENGPSRNYVSIYLKLFLLTGITWVFQIIDGLFEISPFSYLVSVLNGSQGLYVMISFVFNERVKRMIQEMVVPDKFKQRKSNIRSSRCTGEIPIETSGLES